MNAGHVASIFFIGAAWSMYLNDFTSGLGLIGGGFGWVYSWMLERKINGKA